MVERVFQLAAGVQSYDWGKIGSSSKAAQYALATGFDLDESKPYAELWMGTHPSCPSTRVTTGEPLIDYLKAHPDLLGDNVTEYFGKDLPFLFKVLAIEKALSIQAHPDKKLAERLHKDRPDVYKDANHKPEMAIAITPFSGFCGFLPPKDIATYLNIVPELASLVSSSVTSSFISTVEKAHPGASSTEDNEDDPIKHAIEKVFGAVMKSDDEVVQKTVKAIVERYQAGSDVKSEEQGVKDLLLKLNTQFPGDVGILCVYLLNVVELEPGQAVFLKANEPHAYISGDIIETMATSDNVVRAGLTPKLRDVPTLLSMLTYTYQPASNQLMPPAPFEPSKHTTLYDPPIEEFSVARTVLKPGEEDTHRAIDGPSIFIVTKSKGGKVRWSEGTRAFEREGEVWFVGKGEELVFAAASTSGKNGNEDEEGLVVYRAFVEAPAKKA